MGETLNASFRRPPIFLDIQLGPSHHRDNSTQAQAKPALGEVAQDSERLLLVKRLQGGGSDVPLCGYIEHEGRISFVVGSLDSHHRIVFT